METILVTGGTGLVGSHLCHRLREKGYRVTLLSRYASPNTDPRTYLWDVARNEIDEEAVKTADYIIHLAGANIGGKRWSAERKRVIIDSRVRSAELLFNAVKAHNPGLKAFISASATGYYGSVTSGTVFQETAPPGNDFQGETCRQWEEAAGRFKELGIRTVMIRTGVVLSKTGGALAKMMIPVRLGIGSALGNGQQYMPWIHIDDLCSIYIKALEDAEMKGAYNAAAPGYTSNREFMKTLARVVKKPFWFPDVPAFALRMLFGHMSDVLLYGSRVSPDKIMAAGYTFFFPDLENALNDLTGTKK